MKQVISYLFILLLTLAPICSEGKEAAADRGQEVRDVVTAFVAARTAGMGWDIRIRQIAMPDALKLPDGTLDYEVVAPQQWEGWGSASLSVLARLREKVVGNISVRIDVEALADTVVTARQIDQGDAITAGDLVLQKREITRNSTRVSRRIEDVAGKKARATIKANQVVRTDQVEKIPLVKSGQMVTIVAENSVMRVSVAGKARSSGAEGDIVIVQNLNSLKEIPARVISASIVRVAF